MRVRLCLERAYLVEHEMVVDRADELQGKHTLFGRCVGDTIYSVSFIGVSASDTAVDTRVTQMP